MEPSTTAAANSTAKERERKCFIDGAFASMNDKMLTMIKSQQSETVSLVFIIFTISNTTNTSSLFFSFFSVGQEVQNILRLLREMSRIRQAFLAEHSEDNEEERVRVMDEIQGLLCEDHPRMP